MTTGDIRTAPGPETCRPCVATSRVTRSTPICSAPDRPGTNASLNIDGVPFTSSTNTVTGAIQGVTLNLVGQSSTQVQLTVAADQGQITDAVNNFISAYNTAISTINSQYVVDPTGSIPAPPLESDTSLRSLQASLLTDSSYAIGGNSEAARRAGTKRERRAAQRTHGPSPVRHPTAPSLPSWRRRSTTLSGAPHAPMRHVGSRRESRWPFREPSSRVAPSTSARLFHPRSFTATVTDARWRRSVPSGGPASTMPAAPDREPPAPCGHCRRIRILKFRRC